MPSTTRPVYESAADALAATDWFYGSSDGFEYTPQQVRHWLALYAVNLPTTGRVLDLCCGDGVWSAGLAALQPGLELHGIDISTGGIEKARRNIPEHASRFVVGDVEQSLPWPDGTFDLIFARGPGLFNQHSMDRPATIAVIEMWHRALKPNGRMISIFYSSPQLMGTYTNPLKVALPYNRAPRLTEAVDFTGGKYHHTIESFQLPFRKATNVKLGAYRFVRNNHILETKLKTES